MTLTLPAPPAAEKIPITTKSPEALAHFQKGAAFFENARAAEGIEGRRQIVEYLRFLRARS